MAGKKRDFKTPHNRLITNYVGPGPLLLDEFMNHITGSMLPSVPEHLVQYQKELRQKKSNVSHFFGVLDETFGEFAVSGRLKSILQKAFVNAKIEETQITTKFLENLMEALDGLKESFPIGSPDRAYLDKLVSTIFQFYKLLRTK